MKSFGGDRAGAREIQDLGQVPKGHATMLLNQMQLNKGLDCNPPMLASVRTLLAINNAKIARARSASKRARGTFGAARSG